MPAPYILAKDLRSAHNFARETLGLERGRYRIVHSSSTISSVRGTDLYLVPGWEGRFDRFAVRGALRYTRLNVIDGAEVAPVEVVEGEPDGLVPDGVQLVLVSQQEAHDLLTTIDDEAEEPPVAPVTETLEPAIEVAPKKNKRRSRCKECGTLHFKGDLCAEQPLTED